MAGLVSVLLAACSGNIGTPASLGPDLARIRIVNVETRVAQNADLNFPEGEAEAAIAARQGLDREERQALAYRTPREREADLRARITRDLDAAVVEALRGLPSGDTPAVLEVLVTRYVIRGLVRGALLGSDHQAEATVTLRDALSGKALSEPLSVRAESTEQVAALGGLTLRAVRAEPSDRLNASLTAEIRAAFDQVAR